MKKYLIAIFLGLVFSNVSFAGLPLITDDFKTVEKGKFVLDLGSFSSQSSYDFSSNHEVSMQIIYGLLNNMDLGINVPYSLGNPAGLMDAEINSKVKILSFGQDEGISMKAILKLANADSSSGLGSGLNDYSVLFISSKRFGSVLTHYNLGYTIVGVPSGLPNSNKINFGFAIEKEIYPSANMMFEIYGNSVVSYQSYVNCQIASNWQVNDFYKVCVGYSVDIDNNSQDISTIGVTFYF